VFLLFVLTLILAFNGDRSAGSCEEVVGSCG
jgi:hypothetical protein